MRLVDNFFEQLNDLPMLPKVVQDVIQLLNQENVDIRELANLIGKDVMLSARILRMSNSVHFGASRSITTIEDATKLIGLNQIKTLTIASGMRDAFKDIPGFNLNQFWLHSLVTASIARQIAHELKLATETAYLAALMHAIGQLPLHLVFPDASKNIDALCTGRDVLERKSVEHSLLGIDHCEVGAMLAKLWEFPDDITTVIRFYADPLNKQAGTLAAVTYLAAHMAFDLIAGKDAPYIADTINPVILAKLGFGDADLLIQRISAYRMFVYEAKGYL
jgi:putative nucleotidyltransferase with HDIG domain